MIEGVTQTGFKFSINKSSFEDYELFELISEVDENPLAMPKLLKLLLGDQVSALKDHVRKEDGTVPMMAISEEIKDIFSANQEVKN